MTKEPHRFAQPWFVGEENERKLTENLRRAMIEKGLVSVEALDWIAPLFIEAMQQGQLDGLTLEPAIIRHGDEMTRPERKHLGIEDIWHISWQFWDALTEEGRKDPERAARVTLHWAMFWQDREGRLNEQLKRGWNELRLSVVMDSRTCAAAKSVHGSFIMAEDFGGFPLPGCDAEICRCTFMAGRFFKVREQK